MSDNKFFFEEDPAAEESGVTWNEHADTFFHGLKEADLLKEREKIDFAPMGTQVEMQTEHKTTKLVDIEFGVVKSDYVIHITPVHSTKNLTKRPLLEEAVKHAVVELNKVVPSNLNVEIFLPREDYEIKAISFIIREGADAWNLDMKKLSNEVVPKMLEDIGKICMKG